MESGDTENKNNLASVSGGGAASIVDDQSMENDLGIESGSSSSETKRRFGKTIDSLRERKGAVRESHESIIEKKVSDMVYTIDTLSNSITEKTNQLCEVRQALQELQVVRDAETYSYIKEDNNEIIKLTAQTQKLQNGLEEDKKKLNKEVEKSIQLEKEIDSKSPLLIPLNAIIKLCQTMGTLIDKIVEGKEKSGEAIKDLKGRIDQNLGDLKQTLSEKCNAAKESLSEKSTNTKESLSTGFGKLGSSMRGMAASTMGALGSALTSRAEKLQSASCKDIDNDTAPLLSRSSSFSSLASSTTSLDAYKEAVEDLIDLNDTTSVDAPLNTPATEQDKSKQVNTRQ